MEKEQRYYTEQIDSGYLSKFQAISVMNALIRTNTHRKISIVVITNTNQTVMDRRGFIVCRGSPVVNVNSVLSGSNNIDISNGVVPSEFMAPAQKLLEKKI